MTPLSQRTFYEGNVQELCVVIHSKSPFQELIADCTGNVLFSKKSLLGGVFSSLYWATRQSKKGQRARIKLVIQNTHNYFCSYMEHLLSHHQIFRRYCTNQLAGVELDPSAVMLSKQEIVIWGMTTKPFLKRIKGATQAFSELLSTISLKEGCDAPFRLKLTQKLLSKDNDLIALEERLNFKFPLKTLYRAAVNAELTELETSQLKEFSTALNQKIHQKKLSMYELTKALEALIFLFDELKQKRDHPSLSNLVVVLAGQQALLFSHSDHAHLEWRKEYGKGSVIEHEEIQYILGDEITTDSSKENKRVVFHIENSPNLVAVFDINRLAVPLRHFLATNHPCGINGVPFLFIDKKGRFGLMEKLGVKLSDSVWKDAEVIREGTKTHEILAPVVFTLRWFIHNNVMCTHFDPLYLYYDAHSILRCNRPTTELPLSLVALEEFIVRLAKGDETVFKYVMTNGNLHQHVHAHFFHEVVKQTCRLENSHIRELAGINGITDPFYEVTAEKLVTEIKSLMQTCTIELVNAGFNEMNNIADVGKLLLDVYNERACLTRMPSNAKELVMKKAQEKSG